MLRINQINKPEMLLAKTKKGNLDTLHKSKPKGSWLHTFDLSMNSLIADTTANVKNERDVPCEWLMPQGGGDWGPETWTHSRGPINTMKEAEKQQLEKHTVQQNLVSNIAYNNLFFSCLSKS
jgi:hypothetical protein